MAELSENVKRALQRPGNYHQLLPAEQWDIDESLGILDWEPTPEEVQQFKTEWEKRK